MVVVGREENLKELEEINRLTVGGQKGDEQTER
jgi:hypothetical protein